MTKAIISNRIYFNADSETAKKLMSELTYKIEVVKGAKGNFNSFEIIRNYKVPAKGVISIPQGRFDLIPEGLEIVDKRTLVPVDFPKPKHELFPEQKVVYDEVDDTCLINALVGWGKTFTALHCAAKLGQKTLVICHTTFLRDQWIDEIRELFGIEAGIIGSGEYNVDAPIVVGNIQTITKMVPQLSKMFGLVILDECHHVPATTFSTVLDGMYSRYRIGLSGTLKRKDGKQVVFKDYFGHKIFKPPQNNTMNPTVHILKTGVKLKPGAAWVQKINALLYDEDYQRVVAATVRKYVNQGHKVLVLANRTEFLEGCHRFYDSNSVTVTSKTTKDERDEIKEAINEGILDVIFGSIKIFAEGISINGLSCLILPEPYNNEVLLEQIVGRIQRKHPEKLDPIIVDFNFSGITEKKQNNARLGFYLAKGWEIVQV